MEFGDPEPQTFIEIEDPGSLSGKLQIGAKALLEIAATLLGLSYIAGFLVTYTFQSRLGIHDANAELLRIRYMHTGVLCLTVPLFFVTPITAHLWMLLEQKKHEAQYRKARESSAVVGKSHVQYTLQLFCISGVLCAYVLFEPYGEFHRHLLWIVLNLGLIMVQLSFFKKFAGFAAEGEQNRVRWLLAAITIGFSYLSISGTVVYLGHIIAKALSYWVFIISLSFYLALSLPVKLKFWYLGQKEGIHLTRWAVTSTLSILTILTFAFRAYPYIPADKGGGNFKYSRNAIVCVDPKKELPPAVRDASQPKCTVVVKVIELTDSLVYVARVDDLGRNESGQLPPGDSPKDTETWSDGYFPNIYSIPREKVEFISYSFAP